MAATSIVAATSAAIALLSNIVNKPADRSFIERFIFFVVIFTVMFIATAMIEQRKKMK